MVILSPNNAKKITEKILGEGRQVKDNYNYNWSRYINADWKTTKRGWSYIKDKDKITVITSKLYNVAPYQRDKRSVTIDANKPGNIMKLKKWANRVKLY